MKGTIRKKVGERTGTVWQWRFDHVDSTSGRRVTKRGSAPTKTQAERDLREAIRKVESGQASLDERITVREYLIDRWLPSIAGTVRASTAQRYATVVKAHLVPELGGIRLAKLSALDVQRYYADRLEAGYSPGYVRYDHTVLSRALKQAVRMRVIERNVCELVDAPRTVDRPVAAWDAAEVAKVLDAGDGPDGSNLAALWRLALLTGMRRGEILALRWDDVDLDRATLAVRYTLLPAGGTAWELGEPKSKSSRRTIALDASCVAALRKHRAGQNAERLRLGAIWEDHGFVFTTETGRPLHPNTLFGRFKRLIAAAGVRPIRFHDLRHTCATLALVQGVHPKVVQERLGHSKIAMTLDRYSHVTEGLQRDAAESIAAAVEAARKAAS